MKCVTNEELTKTIKEVVDNKDLSDLVLNIILKIKDLPSGTKTTLAKLIDYKPEKSFISPLIQGKVRYCVEEVCKQIEIKLEKERDSIGGLAYFDEFTKC